MEVRAYWRIIMRRWWIVAGLVVATAFLSWLTSPLTQGNYQATLRVLISLPGQPPTGPTFVYDRYYSFLSTEYLVDDIIEVINSKIFRDAVVQDAGSPAPGAFRIEAQPRRERAPRVVTVTVTADSAAEAQGIGDSTAKMIVSKAPQYFNQPGLTAPTAQVIDPPLVSSATTGGRNYLNIVLRALAGLLVGLGLVFLLHYLDPKIYEADDASRKLDLPVLVSVPPYKDG